MLNNHYPLKETAALLWGELAKRRRDAGYWQGALSTSALSTATAISALSVCLIHWSDADGSPLSYRQTEILEKIRDGVQWLRTRQNPDGGWGDTEKSVSNSSTTLLVKSALTLAEQVKALSFDPIPLLQKAEVYLNEANGIEGIKARYGTDRTFVIPILTNAALAGLVPWSAVTALPFELAALPRGLFRFLRLPVVSYAIPALVAIGQVRFHALPPRNPMIRFLRRRAIPRTLKVLREMQPESGGFLEATPLVSFVLMGLAGSGRLADPVSVNAIRFLMTNVLPNGSWPIDTNLATWLTTLAVNAVPADSDILRDENLLNWILACQLQTKHPFTAAAPGGWPWTNLSGGVPDADDTPGALLALTKMFPNASAENQKRIARAMVAGLNWLLNLQNANGGFPTFCRGWGKLPFDRSSVDLTAHAIRAFLACREIPELTSDQSLFKRLAWSAGRGIKFILKNQRKDGSWLPLWFGNQHLPDDENPFYGTGKVLTALARMPENGFLPKKYARKISAAIEKGISWAVQHQNPDGGWGRQSNGFPENPSASTLAASGSAETATSTETSGLTDHSFRSTLEETAIVLEALLQLRKRTDNGIQMTADLLDSLESCCDKGLEELVRMIQAKEYEHPVPVGFYFTKLWYFEELYPMLFGLSALTAGSE